MKMRPKRKRMRVSLKDRREGPRIRQNPKFSKSARALATRFVLKTCKKFACGMVYRVQAGMTALFLPFDRRPQSDIAGKPPFGPRLETYPQGGRVAGQRGLWTQAVLCPAGPTAQFLSAEYDGTGPRRDLPSD
jgi:hypothetical protein